VITDTLLAGNTLTGDGIWTLTSEVAFNYITIEVLALGEARKLDTSDPSRLLQLGWFSIGVDGPSAGGYGGIALWTKPYWVEWELMLLPEPFGGDFITEYFADAVRYRMLADASIKIGFWHV